jgi:hypothetical protein
MGAVTMGKLSEKEDAWQAAATAAAVAEARAIAQSRLANTPAGKLNDQQMGWIITAAVFGWIRTRYQQAVAEGLDVEQHVTQMNPSKLADQARIDWSKPLASWSKEEMTNFVELALRLIDEAKAALDRGRDVILRKPEFDDGIPF